MVSGELVSLSTSDFTVHRLQTDSDVEQYLELLRKIWSKDDGVERLAKKLIDYHHGMTLNHFFVAEHEGKMVSTLNLIPVTWSIGGIQLKVAEMGHVGTLPEYRCKGLIRRLVDEYHKQVQQEAYDISIIEGMPYFYRQFGYEYALPLLEETSIRLDKIPEFTANIKVRPFSETDIPTATKLLEQSQRKFYVHSIRDENVWKTQRKTGIASDSEPFQSHTVEEEGKMTAYFRIREKLGEKELILTETTEVDLVTAQAVLSFLKTYGNQHSLERLTANVSYKEPFTQHMVSLGASTHVPTYAWQIRITDYAHIFQKLKPLFEHRLADSMYSKLTDTLNFNFSFTVQVTIEDGKITQTRKTERGERSPIGLNPLSFVQLLTGYRNRQELEATVPDMRIVTSHKHLVDTLFPKMDSHIHSAY
jgi:predicted acetyltransferase